MPERDSAALRAPYDPLLTAWARHENAPRTVCPTCQFESSEGYPPSHAPGCADESAKASEVRETTQAKDGA